MTASFAYRPETPDDVAAIEALHANLFGPERFQRAAYVLRDGVPYLPELAFVAEDSSGALAGSVRLTPITIGKRPALILGPLVVRRDLAGKGVGRSLVRMSLEAARAGGHAVVMLVGDLPYYGPLGFRHLGRDAILLPAPVDPDRVLVAELQPGALHGLGGAAESVAVK